MILISSMIRFKRKQKSAHVIEKSYWILIFKIKLWQAVLFPLNVNPKSSEDLESNLIVQTKQRLEVAKEDLKENKLKTVARNSSFLEKSVVGLGKLLRWVASKICWILSCQAKVLSNRKRCRFVLDDAPLTIDTFIEICLKLRRGKYA